MHHVYANNGCLKYSLLLTFGAGGVYMIFFYYWYRENR